MYVWTVTNTYSFFFRSSSSSSAAATSNNERQKHEIVVMVFFFLPLSYDEINNTKTSFDFFFWGSACLPDLRYIVREIKTVIVAAACTPFSLWKIKVSSFYPYTFIYFHARARKLPLRCFWIWISIKLSERCDYLWKLCKVIKVIALAFFKFIIETFENSHRHVCKLLTSWYFIFFIPH